jgi:hypothetical protein
MARLRAAVLSLLSPGSGTSRSAKSVGAKAE